MAVTILQRSNVCQEIMTCILFFHHCCYIAGIGGLGATLRTALIYLGSSYKNNIRIITIMVLEPVDAVVVVYHGSQGEQEKTRTSS